MSNPRYMHHYDPRRKDGHCKVYVGGSICGQPEEFIAHERFAAKEREMIDARDETIHKGQELVAAMAERERYAEEIFRDLQSHWRRKDYIGAESHHGAQVKEWLTDTEPATMMEFWADACITETIEGECRDVIVHRNAEGVACFHSPLTDGAVKCSICETSGTKVRIENMNDTEPQPGKEKL